MNSQREKTNTSALSESIVPQMQDVVGAVLARELREVPTVNKRPHNITYDMQDPIGNK